MKYKHYKASNVKVAPQTLVTWLFGVVPTFPNGANKVTYTFDFSSNGMSFTKVVLNNNQSGTSRTISYFDSDGNETIAYNGTSSNVINNLWTNQNLRTITCNNSSSGYLSFLSFLQTNATIQTTKNYYFKPYTILGLYKITATLSNVQASPTNVDRIQENSSVTLNYAKITSSYPLPDSVEVTNATYTWDKDTGALTLSNPTGDVSITITATSLPQLDTPTNVAVTDTTLTFDEVENATSYEVYVDNVSIGTFEVGGVTKVTYLLNSNPDVFTTKQYNASFTSNGQQFTTIDLQASGMLYNETLVYYDGGPEGMVWTNDAFRTLVFDEEPTGDLLTWLNANGTRQ